jgi:hypothetical protein
MALKILEPIATNEDSVAEQPERNLWLAVVERALKDYCFFFDRLSGRDQNDRVLITISNFKKNKFNWKYQKVVADYDRLNWFLFDRTPTPFNLEYICTLLYEDSDGMLSALRREAKKHFKRHMLDSDAANRYKIIVDYVMQYSNDLETIDAASVESKLRYKRYRLTNSDS